MHKSLTVNVPFKTQCWKDKATGCWLVYSKKYNISGYGKTKKEAKEMFSFIILDIVKSATATHK